MTPQSENKNVTLYITKTCLIVYKWEKRKKSFYQFADKK